MTTLVVVLRPYNCVYPVVGRRTGSSGLGIWNTAVVAWCCLGIGGELLVSLSFRRTNNSQFRTVTDKGNPTV